MSGVVQGIALLLLAALSPFSLLKLIPMFESGAAAHLEGLSRRGIHAGVSAATLVAGAPELGAAGVAGVATAAAGGVEFAEGAHLGGAEYLAAVSHFREEIARREAPSAVPVAEAGRVGTPEASFGTGEGDA